MKKRFLSVISMPIFVLTLIAHFSFSHAAVPTYYKGVPYPLNSAPKEIPGHISFHDYDKGGPNISFEQDDMASGHWGGCFAAFRDTGIYKDGDPDHPSFTMTNHYSSPSDTFYAQGIAWPNGSKYPSSDTTMAANHWYIGAIHADDHFNFTIHVPKSGKYWVSSVWAAGDPALKYELLFLGTQYAATANAIKSSIVEFPGQNSYHAWRTYADFVSVQLDSGIQVLQFHTLSKHLNLDFLYFSADSGTYKFPTVTKISELKKGTQKKLFKMSINKDHIHFILPETGFASVKLFDCLNRQMATLVNRSLSAGEHGLLIDKSAMKSGMYFVKLEFKGKSEVMDFRISE